MSASSDSLAYIRRYYRVPANRGQRVLFDSGRGPRWLGTIIGGEGPHLRVRFDRDRRRSHILHPTWEVEYLRSRP